MREREILPRQQRPEFRMKQSRGNAFPFPSTLMTKSKSNDYGATLNVNENNEMVLFVKLQTFPSSPTSNSTSSPSSFLFSSSFDLPENSSHLPLVAFLLSK